MNNELKPCRLCGNKDVYITKYIDGYNLKFDIICLSCKMRTAIFRNRDELIKQWDNRTNHFFPLKKKNIKFTRFEIMDI